MRIVKTKSQKRMQEAAELAFRLEGKTFEHLTLSSQALWIVLNDDDEVVGAAGASKKRHVLELTIAFLAPEARGKGLQSDLVKLRLRWGKREGCTIAYTYVYRRNHASMASLIKNNFSPYHVDSKSFCHFARFL